MDFAELMRQIFLILLGNSICLILLDRKYSLKKTLVIYGITTAVVIALGISILVLLGRDGFLSLYPIIINGTTLCALFYLSKRKGLPVIFTMLTVIIIATVICVPVYSLSQAVGQSILTEILLKTIIAILAIIFLYRYLRPSYLQMLAVVQRGWGYMCLIPGLFYALILPNMINNSFPVENQKAFLTCILALIIVIVSYGVIFTLFGRIIRESEMNDEKQLLKIQMQAMERHADLMKKNEEQVQIYRHDLRHYIANIKVLLESDNTEDALHVLDSLDEKNGSAPIPYYCGDPIINAILVYYIQKAQHEGITVETDCRLPEKLPMESSEFAAVLANAIENAFHACSEISKGRERFIRIKLLSSPQLALEITNSYTGNVVFDEKGLPVSGEIGHGLGTKSIAAFVEKHDGIIEYSADDKLFRLRLLVGA